MPATHFHGNAGGVWVPVSNMIPLVGTWTLTRNAAGNMSYNLTAAANSPFLVVPLKQGVVLSSFDVVFSIATAGLTTFTGGLYQTTHVNGAVASIVNKLAPAALGVATTTNITVVNTAVAPAYVVGANETPDVADYLELAVVNPGTSVLKIYGVFLYGNAAI